jgi:uncharacterized protein (DUF2062 family)
MPRADISLADKSIGEWIPAMLDWLGSLGKPLLVGIPMLAVILAVIGYFAVDWAWRSYVRYLWHRRKRQRRVKL